jgi:hypothetical protein
MIHSKIKESSQFVYTGSVMCFTFGEYGTPSFFRVDDFGSRSCIFNILSKMIMEAFPPNNFAICAFNSISYIITMPTWLACPMYIATKTQKSTSSPKCNYPDPPKTW